MSFATFLDIFKASIGDSTSGPKSSTWRRKCEDLVTVQTTGVVPVQTL